MLYELLLLNTYSGSYRLYYKVLGFGAMGGTALGFKKGNANNPCDWTAKNKLINESVNAMKIILPAFTCSKLTTETLEQGVKYVQS